MPRALPTRRRLRPRRGPRAFTPFPSPAPHPMDKVTQALFSAEYERFVQHDGAALTRLDETLRPLFRQHFLRVDVPQVQRRVRALGELPDAPAVDSHYLHTFGVRGVMRYGLTNGVTIYKLPVFSFQMSDWKDHWTAAYLIVGRTTLSLVDPGTHLSEASLRQALEVVSAVYHQPVRLEDVQHIVITHAHFDHFGGLAFAGPASGAQVWAHEWDARTISNYADEVQAGRVRITEFLHRAGMEGGEIGTFMKMHELGKQIFPGHPVHHAFGDGARIVEDYEVIHAPGHCPGLSCIRVGDILLLGDQVLNNVTPHQFPKIYKSGSGLHNYLNSLIKVAARSEGLRLGLPSHYGDIADVEARAMEIVHEHHQRIADLLKDLHAPKSLQEITSDYYRFRRGRDLAGYEQLLALEEIGAHVEYMIENLGLVRVANPGEAAGNGIVRYERVA
jgi:glyoxylase-like metal-dependent hydrolase (beta-lactamase superfamily II)